MLKTKKSKDNMVATIGDRKKQTKVRITKKNVHQFIEAAIDDREYGEALDLVGRFKASGFTATYTTLKKKYKLTEKQIEGLEFREVKNPHYSTASRMRFYLIKQVELIKSQE
jgi:hypothetical protein